MSGVERERALWVFWVLDATRDPGQLDSATMGFRPVPGVKGCGSADMMGSERNPRPWRHTQDSREGERPKVRTRCEVEGREDLEDWRTRGKASGTRIQEWNPGQEAHRASTA